MGKSVKTRHVVRKLPRYSLLLAQVSLGTLIWAADGRAGSFDTSDFQVYDAATAASIQAGQFALYEVPVDSLIPTQLNVGISEVATKTAGFNLDTPGAGLTADLLTDVEPVVIGPGGVLYQTNGHHTFTALVDSVYGASDPDVFVDVIANFSNMTEQEFFATMEADNFLYPVNDGQLVTIDPNTGAPLPSSLAGLTNDPYRALEYRVLKNKGAASEGFDKTSAFFSDFIWADAYRDADGGLGLPFLSPADWNAAAAWSQGGTNQTTLPGITGSVSVAQLPGYILPANIVISGTISDATLTGAEGQHLVLDGSQTGTFDESSSFASFNGIEGLDLGPVTVGSTSPGFVLQLGNDSGNSVALTGINTYTGGTTILAGTLVVASDESLGAAVPNGATIDPLDVQDSVQNANGILFNSLSEGTGTLQIGTASGQYTSADPFVSARPIAVGGEIAELDLNGNVVELTGSLASLSDNEAGTPDLSIEDTSSAANGVVILAPASGGSPDFFGNIILSGGTLEVGSDAALGNITGPADTIGTIDLDGGTFKPLDSFSSVRDLIVTSGSTFDTNGTATSFDGTLTDDQRTLAVINSDAGSTGSVAFGNLDLGATVNLTVTAASGGGSTSVDFTNGFTREAGSTLILIPTSGTLGTTEKVFSSGASTDVTNGIVAPWIIVNNGASNNPYDFATYGANGYAIATYTSTDITTATATSVVKQAASASLTGNTDAFALNIQKGDNVTIGAGHTLTLGDGTDPAGLILNGGSGSGLTGGTLAFGSSEAVISINGSSTITSELTGTGGLTLDGSGTLTLNTATDLTGPITIASGQLTLGAANAFTGDSILLDDVKSKPAASTLALSASQQFAAVNSVGNNSTITLASGTTLTIGDSQNLDSTILSGITESGSATAGAITKDGTGLLDLTGISKGKLNLVAGSSIVVNAGDLRVTSTTFKNNNIINVASGTEVQFDEKGGGVFGGQVEGAGVLHLLTGTLQLTGTTNTYSGGTVIEDGSTLDLTTANISSGNANIVDSGGTVLFDQSTNGTYAGVISDGHENEDSSAPVLSGSLVKEDSSTATPNAGNLTLAAVQTYTGATTVEAGTLTLGIADAIADSSGVTLGRVGGGSVANLALNADNTLQGLSSEAGNTTGVQLGAFTLTLDSTAGTSTSFGGVISGSGGLVEAGAAATTAGAGTNILTGINTYTGGTDVQSGELDVTGSGTLGTGGVSITGGTLGVDGDANLAGNAVSVTGGTLKTGGSLSTSAITVDGGTIESTATGSTLSNIVLGSSGGTVQADPGRTILASSLGSAGGLTVTGGGTVELTGSSTIPATPPSTTARCRSIPSQP
jgi:fibronectin-binding autotransporter adhesin